MSVLNEQMALLRQLAVETNQDHAAQCSLSRGEVCLELAAEEMGRSALVMRHLSCGLLSRCAGSLRGIENVRVVFVGSCVARSHPVVLVLCCLCAALQIAWW